MKAFALLLLAPCVFGAMPDPAELINSDLPAEANAGGKPERLDLTCVDSQSYVVIFPSHRNPLSFAGNIAM